MKHRTKGPKLRLEAKAPDGPFCFSRDCQQYDREDGDDLAERIFIADAGISPLGADISLL
jgi:hypothetical protein